MADQNQNYRSIAELPIQTDISPTITLYCNPYGVSVTDGQAQGGFRQLPLSTVLASIQSGNFALIREVTTLPENPSSVDKNILYLTKDENQNEILYGVVATGDPNHLSYKYQQLAVSSTSVIEDLYGDIDSENYTLDDSNKYLDLQDLGKQAVSVRFVQQAIDAVLASMDSKIEELKQTLQPTAPANTEFFYVKSSNK